MHRLPLPHHRSRRSISSLSLLSTSYYVVRLLQDTHPPQDRQLTLTRSCSNLLHNLLGDPPTLPHLLPAAPSDAPPYDQSFPPSDPIVPSVDNTSSTLQTAPVLGGHADNLKGGVVGKDYSASTLQGAHFPTPSTTDDHPGGGDSTSSGPAPPGAILGGHADNFQGGVIGKDYSASTLQGAHFPTTSSTDDHPGGNHPSSSSTVVNSYSTGTPHECQPVQNQSEQVAKQADRDFAPTSENVPASEGEKERGGPAAVVEDQHDKKGLKDKLKSASCFLSFRCSSLISSSSRLQLNLSPSPPPTHFLSFLKPASTRSSTPAARPPRRKTLKCPNRPTPNSTRRRLRPSSRRTIWRGPT